MISLDPEMISRPDRTAVIMARDFTMETRSGIPSLFAAYLEADAAIDATADDGFVGISFAMSGSGAFRYGVGQIVDKVPADVPTGFEALHIPAGEYAVFRHFGPVGDLPVLFDRVFREWLPASGYKVSGGPVIERYPEDARNSEDALAYEIWAPVVR